MINEKLIVQNVVEMLVAVRALRDKHGLNR